jgi:short-subunit dehydrogenase
MIAAAGVHRFSSGRAFDALAAGEVISTNVVGVINAFGAVLPDMVARRSGRLVAISSIAGIIPLPGAGAYCASKAALLTLCGSLQLDLRKTNVRLTTVLPGFVDTPLLGEHDRSNIGVLVSPEEAARRIALAVDSLPFRVSAAMWEGLARHKRSRRAAETK